MVTGKQIREPESDSMKIYIPVSWFIGNLPDYYTWQTLGVKTSVLYAALFWITRRRIPKISGGGGVRRRGEFRVIMNFCPVLDLWYYTYSDSSNRNFVIYFMIAFDSSEKM